jgi:acyl carrier protein
MSTAMTKDEILATALKELTTVAPDLADEIIPPDADLREVFDLDSMDFLNWFTALHRRLGADIPELDYPRLRSLDEVAIYLAGRLGGH